MTKKIIISVVSILATAVIIGCLAMFLFHRQNERKLQTGMEEFGIQKTDDIIIENYENNGGLWNDQSLDLSTQKDFDQFVGENIMAPVTVTDESDSQSKTNPEDSNHVISFEYNIDNQEIHGRFSMRSSSETNYVTLLING